MMASSFKSDLKKFVLTDLSDKVQMAQLDPAILNRVDVSSIISYDHIFVQKIDEQFEENMKNVSALDLRFASLWKPKCISKPIQPNTMCIVKHCGRFYRALTIGVGENACQVMFADFGGVKQIDNHELYLPLQEFIESPIMAIECIIDFVSIAYADGPFVRVPVYSNYHLVCGEHYVRVLYVDAEGLPHVEFCIKYENWGWTERMIYSSFWFFFVILVFCERACTCVFNFKIMMSLR